MPVQITAQNMLYNNYKGMYGDLINLLILITKQYMYASKCLKQGMSFVNLASKIYEMHTLEKIIALRENNYVKFIWKWPPLIDKY